MGRALKTWVVPSGIIVLGVLLAQGAVAWRLGVRMAPDTTSYSRWADRLIQLRFDYPRFLPEVDSPLRVFYIGWVTVVALAKLVAARYWGEAIVAFNLVADALVALWLWLLIRDVTGRRGAAALAVAFHVWSFEIINYSRFVLSDVTFVALGFAAFYLAARALIGERPRGRAGAWAAAASLAALGVIYRPPGVVLVPLAAVAVYLACRKSSPGQRGPARVVSAAALGTCVVAVVAVTLLNATIVKDPERWSGSSLADAFRVQSREYHRGEVVSARKETYHAPPVALVDYVLITADRFLHFFALTAAGFSRGHTGMNLAWFVPVYAAALLGAVAGLRNLGDRRARVVALSVAVILAFAAFHALTQVDYDWRYRLPVLPHLLFLAGVGTATLEDWWTGNRPDQDGNGPSRG